MSDEIRHPAYSVHHKRSDREQHRRLLRTFISYSRQNKELADAIADQIETMGLVAMWDQNFQYGEGFHDQIQRFIQHSHLFIPVITEESSKSGWVHQEIGFAIANRIPVIPIALDREPEEGLRGLHAIMLNSSRKLAAHKKALRNELSHTAIEHAISAYEGKEHTIYECGDLPEERTLKMVELANQVRQLGQSGILRQQGGLSSLHIPPEVTSHIDWRERYGDIDKGEFHRRLQRKERKALEYHARATGCKLIIDPEIPFKPYGGPPARKSRLGKLLEFLESSDPRCTAIAFSEPGELDISETILGDWFYSKSVSGTTRGGYQQTIFTRHAPSMQEKIDEFDDLFESRLKSLKWKSEDSVNHAKRELKRRLKGLTGKTQKGGR